MNNNRTTNMLEINRRMLKRISTHTIRSIQQAALIERLDPDAVARAMKSFSLYLGGGKLVELSRENRIVLTKLSTEALRLLDGFSDLAENQAQLVDKVRFVISPGIPGDMISLALSRFLFNNGNQVSPEILVAADGIRDLVRSRDFDFAVDLCVADSAEPDEKLVPSIPASLGVFHNHRLAGAGTIDRDHFSESDRVFLSPYIAPFSAELLSRVPAANRIEIADSDFRHRLVSINAGLALEYAQPSLQTGDAFVRLPVIGIEPANLGLWLPRRQDQLSEAAKLLISEIRYVNLPPIPQLEVQEESESLPEIRPLPEPLSA
jgi:hypothetical protein